MISGGDLPRARATTIIFYDLSYHNMMSSLRFSGLPSSAPDPYIDQRQAEQTKDSLFSSAVVRVLWFQEIDIEERWSDDRLSCAHTLTHSYYRFLRTYYNSLEEWREIGAKWREEKWLAVVACPLQHVAVGHGRGRRSWFPSPTCTPTSKYKYDLQFRLNMKNG